MSSEGRVVLIRLVYLDGSDLTWPVIPVDTHTHTSRTKRHSEDTAWACSVHVNN